MSNPTRQEFHILLESGADVNFIRQENPTNEVFLYSLLTNSVFVKMLLYYGCDPNLCFKTGHEVFVRCCHCFLRRESYRLADFLRFLLRFLIITKTVQTGFHAISLRFPGDVKDILEEIGKQFIALFINYSIYLYCK